MKSINPKQLGIEVASFIGTVALFVSVGTTALFASFGANKAYEAGVFEQGPWWLVPFVEVAINVTALLPVVAAIYFTGRFVWNRRDALRRAWA